MYKRKIARLLKQKATIEDKHNSTANGTKYQYVTDVYNYYGGFDLGYIVGMLSVLQDLQDEIDEDGPLVSVKLY